MLMWKRPIYIGPVPLRKITNMLLGAKNIVVLADIYLRLQSTKLFNGVIEELFMVLPLTKNC